MRSLATRQSNLALSPHVPHVLNIVKAAGFDLILLETSGIGQSDTEIVDYSDHSLYVMTPEYGAATQLEKIDMLDFADLVAINKADKEGAEDALRDVRKQYKRNRLVFDADDDELPVHLTVASDFNDPGTNRFYRAFVSRLGLTSTLDLPIDQARKQYVVPPERSRYLAEVVEEIGRYDAWVEDQAGALRGSTVSRGRRRRRMRISPMRSRQPGVWSIRRTCEPWNVGMAWSPSIPVSNTSITCEVVRSGCRFTVRLCPTPASRRWRCRGIAPGEIGWDGCCRRTCPAVSPIPPECSRSSGPPRTRPGCSPGRAPPSRPMPVSTICPKGCRRRGCRPPSTP
jgi:hypothetical protein